MKNAYPEKPVLKYMRTSVEMALIIGHLRALDVPVEVKRAAYIYFRIESANGKSGVNNNYAGIQADGARWPSEFDIKIAGTVVKAENGTGKSRIFIAFNSWQDSIDFTVRNTQRRGMFVGGNTTKFGPIHVYNAADLCMAYKREWVTGNGKYVPNKKEVSDFESMYRQAEKIF